MRDEIKAGEKISLTDSPKDIVIKMSEGNPGAINVMMALLTQEAGEPVADLRFMDLLHMDDMGMRGPAIWIGFKDHCGQDLAKFRAAIRSRDPEMVKTIQAEGYDVATGGKS